MGGFSFPTGGMNINPTGTVGGNTTAGGVPVLSTGGAGNFGYGNMNPGVTNLPGTGMPANPGGPYQAMTGGVTSLPGTGVPQNPGGPYQAQSSSMNPGGVMGGPSGVVTGENGQTSSTPNAYGLTQQQQNRNLSEDQNYYGEGEGASLYNYLQSGAGYNSALTQQSVDTQTNAMQQQIQLGANNLESTLGDMGISGNSSAQGALANYYSQAGAQENAITAQEYYNMWNQSQDRLLSQQEQIAGVNATGTANQMNWMDYLNEGLQIAGAVAMI